MGSSELYEKIQKTGFREASYDENIIPEDLKNQLHTLESYLDTIKKNSRTMDGLNGTSIFTYAHASAIKIARIIRRKMNQNPKNADLVKKFTDCKTKIFEALQNASKIFVTTADEIKEGETIGNLFTKHLTKKFQTELKNIIKDIEDKHLGRLFECFEGYRRNIKMQKGPLNEFEALAIEMHKNLSLVLAVLKYFSQLPDSYNRSLIALYLTKAWNYSNNTKELEKVIFELIINILCVVMPEEENITYDNLVKPISVDNFKWWKEKNVEKIIPIENIYRVTKDTFEGGEYIKEYFQKDLDECMKEIKNDKDTKIIEQNFNHLYEKLDLAMKIKTSKDFITAIEAEKSRLDELKKSLCGETEDNKQQIENQNSKETAKKVDYQKLCYV